MADVEDMRQCSACEVSQPLEQFSKSPGYTGGRRRQCRKCRTAYEQRRRSTEGFAYKLPTPEESHARHIKLKYGLSRDAYREMLNSQGGACGICREVESGAHFRNLVVDHCHKTGRVRGLLCNRCNLALGKFGDDINGLRSAIAYLEKAETSHG